MLWLVFPELQNIVGEFYFRVSGEVNRVSGKNGSRKHYVHGVHSEVLGSGMYRGGGQKSAVKFSWEAGKKVEVSRFFSGARISSTVIARPVTKGKGGPCTRPKIITIF